MRRKREGDDDEQAYTDWPHEPWLIRPGFTSGKTRTPSVHEVLTPGREARAGTFRTASYRLKASDANRTRLHALISRLDSRPSPSGNSRARSDPSAFAAWLTDKATHGLGRRFPDDSASQTVSRGQRLFLVTLASLLLVWIAAVPLLTLQVVAGVATLFFALVVMLRVVACVNIMALMPLQLLRQPEPLIADQDLPVYTVLVPLYQEASVVSGLVQALMRLDYPADKLDIKIILESVDRETINKVRSLRLQHPFEIIVVPDSQPRTKPKALNFALQLARGEYVVVYDAEDRPSPDQLRKALAAFARGPANLACLQARLTIYNGAENWISKQSALEYGALFRGLLPTFQALGLPIPLGGTSNHFRISALRWLGGWDAFNVTEDADLGMRLYKHGYICHVLDSETGEEAPCSLKAWIPQRTRWLKGWMQTWLVHARRPFRLWRRLGTGRFLSFHVITAGTIVSALAHPVFWLLLALELTDDRPFGAPGSLIELHVWLLALFNVAMGLIASMVLSLIALRQTRGRFALHILLMPAYWLLVSAAAYRALLHLAIRPFHWEKTEHGVTRMEPPMRERHIS